MDKVDYFKNGDFLDIEFMQAVAEKMECKIFKRGDILMRKGDKGDRLYIAIKGRLGINNSAQVSEDEQPIAVIAPFTAVGDKALTSENNRRTATVVCLDRETITLSLNKENFSELLGRQIIVSKGFRYSFMVKFLPEIFDDWSKAKILDVNDKYFDQFTARKDAFIYDIGQPSEVFYIVRDG